MSIYTLIYLKDSNLEENENVGRPQLYECHVGAVVLVFHEVSLSALLFAVDGNPCIDQCRADVRKLDLELIRFSSNQYVLNY